ncbi:hypothetical protein [Paracoccus sp. (in: a-proteobacteria)]|uniref:hypothetical protein n=1 Tax=Paracoccus sp. TaxID=267 RepID=UPI00289DEF86|nr:hypothetical protein [Paracoccus sp. (in: a-proteobacteria)]
MILPQLTLPWAKTSELSGNSRLHWRKKYKKTAAQKKLVTYLAQEKGMHRIRVPDGALIDLTYVFCPPSNVSSFDDDNAVAAMKGARDALAAVLRIDDSRFRLQAPERGERCKNGAVIVLMEVAA